MASKKPETVPQFEAETASPTADADGSTDRHGRTCSKRDMRADGNMAQQVGADFDDFMALVNEANVANERERDMKLSTAFRTYPKAIGWSVVLSSCILMEGYGTAIIGSYLAYPVFRNRFGTLGPSGEYTISSAWQNGISGATNVGEIIAGLTSERWGYRWTLLAALAGITASIFFPFFAESLAVFLVGEFFQGIAWGVFQTMTIAYAVEVCPVPLRHYLTTFVSLCWITGQFMSSGVLVAFVNRTDVWGYKIPFALQWIWPIPVGVGCILAPESPWWCVRHGRRREAERSLKRLARSSGFTQRDADASLALMIYTDEMEKQDREGTSYRDCFRGADLRRTEIVCMTWLAQAMSGTVVGGLGAFFYQQAGISSEDSFKLGWGQNALSFVGTLCTWFILNKIGRRTLMFSGMCVMFVLLIITGCLGIPAKLSMAESWAAGSLIVLLSAVANFSIGPVVYTIVSEIPSTRLRAKSIILARNAYNAINIAFVNVISYRQLNPNGWSWGPKAAFFWAAETKGRTFPELDILFKNRVPARHFASTKIETLLEGTEKSGEKQTEP
ncbi:hypothetical protein LQW54_005083 [Pestalotiopsis sp. IQ-011]